jgi:hypothetical protein
VDSDLDVVGGLSFQKKHKKETSYDITTTTYKKNTLKTLQQMKLLFTEKHIVCMNLSKFTKRRCFKQKIKISKIKITNKPASGL